MLNPVRCFCGRKPNIDTETKDGMNFSFSCCCGGSSVSVLVRSDNKLKALDLWRKLVINRLTTKTVGLSVKPVQTDSKNEEALSFTPMVIGTRFGSHLFWG